MKTYNLIDADRIQAILIIDQKPYSSCCDHQDALAGYRIEHGYEQPYDFEDEDALNDAINETFQMKNDHEVYGFDIFDTGIGYILAAHDRETLMVNKKWALQYAAENEAKLAFFTEHCHKGYDIQFVRSVQDYIDLYRKLYLTFVDTNERHLELHMLNAWTRYRFDSSDLCTVHRHILEFKNEILEHHISEDELYRAVPELNEILPRNN